MANLLAIFPSLNQVTLIKRALRRSGIYVDMIRTPQCLSFTGCSFALCCDRQQLDLVRRECHTANISPGGFFRKSEEDGEHEWISISVPNLVP
ncbi:MAG: DUF3343 domain-containing protein [Terriglobales bacterium]|jgi:hypothetical protein